jgi:hypothetical protein
MPCDIGRRRGFVRDEIMQPDSAWHAPTSHGLSDALRDWGISGTATCDPVAPNGLGAAGITEQDANDESVLVP